MKAIDMDMTSGKLFKKIIMFSIPVLLSSILQLLYNACDLVVIGSFGGENSLAAVGSTTSLINLLINLFIGVSVGANVVVARAIGKKDENSAQKAVHTAILFSLIAGTIMMFFGIFTSRMWLGLMDTHEDAIDKATLYLQIYFSGMIFNMVYNFGASVLRSVGETKKPLLYLTIAGLVNVSLNLFLVLVFHMDVAGVAIGTIASQAISAVLVIICLCKKTGYVHLNLKKLRIHGKSLLQMLLIGLPAGIQGSLFSISNVFIQKAVNSFNSTTVIAGNTASANIESFVYSAMNSLYHSCVTFTGQNYGAGKIKNCKKVLFYCLASVIVVGLIFGGFAILLAEPLLGMYTKGAEAISYGKVRLVIICSMYFLCGIMDVAVGGLRGLGYSIIPMIVSVAGICGFRIIWIYTVFQSNHTLEVLSYSYPISWLATGAVHLVCLAVVYKIIRKKNPQQIESFHV